MKISLNKAPKATPPTIGDLKMAISIYCHERIHLEVALEGEDDQSIDMASINVGRASQALNAAIEGAMIAIEENKEKDFLIANQKVEIANLRARLAQTSEEKQIEMLWTISSVGEPDVNGVYPIREFGHFSTWEAADAIAGLDCQVINLHTPKSFPLSQCRALKGGWGVFEYGN